MRILTGILGVACAACTHATADNVPALSFACSGSEPFWALDIEGSAATLTTPSDEGIASVTTPGGWIDGDLSDGVVTWRADSATYRIASAQCFSEAGVEFEFETDLAVLFPMSPRAPGCCRRTN